MGIGGIVVHDAEELDLVFQIPLGGGGGGGGGRDEDAAMLPVAMRWDAFVRPEYRERTGFSKALGDAFVENQLESKLKGVVIEGNDDDDRVERRGEYVSSRFDEVEHVGIGVDVSRYEVETEEEDGRDEKKSWRTRSGRRTRNRIK